MYVCMYIQSIINTVNGKVSELSEFTRNAQYISLTKLKLEHTFPAMSVNTSSLTGSPRPDYSE
jgi:hypothetical protein